MTINIINFFGITATTETKVAQDRKREKRLNRNVKMLKRLKEKEFQTVLEKTINGGVQ